MGVGFTPKFLLCSLCSIMMATVSSAILVLIGDNFTLSFEDMDAIFSPTVKSNGICGKLYIAEPLDACSPLTNKVKQDGNYTSPFALIIRGGCSFEDKVREAQKTGFKAAIVYDDEDRTALIAMAGNSTGINIPSVFVSKATGEQLITYAGLGMELWLFPSNGNSAWSIMAISFISLLAMSAILATCFFVRKYRTRSERPHSRVREFHGMSRHLVKAMPSLIFTAVTEDNCTSATCAICLEDYKVGDKLRILPCRHKFHAFCVDAWLTSWRTFCPVCKRDARTSIGEPPASESTPLLSSNPSSAASTPISSFRSSVHSSAIPIASPSPRSHVSSCFPSVSSSPPIPRPPRSSSHRHHSSAMSVSRSTLDLGNSYSRRSESSRFYSPHSLGYYPSSSSLTARYIQSPSCNSSSYHGSSIRQMNPLHYSASAASFSAYASAQSLPEC